MALIKAAYCGVVPLFDMGAAGIFLIARIASGISSSVHGTMAGEGIMQGLFG
ncbi:MAG TPA: hypothetical protein VGY58_21415 [Gemmataceae bacterium]|nr:hypothetical protein [Gemmataceae bacterium]